MSRNIVIIGGGASGLIAAIAAARSGAKVTILEQNKKLGKKLLCTGNGRCNLTNLNQSKEKYRSKTPSFAQQVLEHFSVDKTICFFQQLGICLKNREGYLYPRSNQASTIVETLEIEIRHLKIKCKTMERAEYIEKSEKGYTVITKTWSYPCDAVILACGSKASAIAGSDGSGYQLAKKIGHTVIEPVPALVGLKGDGNWFSKWAGVRCDCKVCLFIDQRFCVSDTGEIQLTDYGISGIPVFQISRYAAEALQEKKRVHVELDFLPEMSFIEAVSFLENAKKNHEKKEMHHLLNGLVPTKLACIAANPECSITQSVEVLKRFSLSIQRTMNFENAQVCAGGVACKEIDADTMESKVASDIYFCGELLDVDGACGGYNLQWAWSSGYLAGISASREVL